MPTNGIGRRIAYWRERRGFTQADFGRLMGQSRRWVQDVEGGHRQTDPRLSILERAADILRIPLEQLLTDAPAPPPRAQPPAPVLAVVDALHHTVDQPAPQEADLRRRLTYCCGAFQACHYGALARELPKLLTLTRAAVAAANLETRSSTHAILSRVYQLTASYLQKYGEATLPQASVAADRALAAAEIAADPVAIAAASRRVTKNISRQGRPGAAVVFASTTANRLRADLETRGPEGLSTLGMLYLSAAIAATGNARSPDAINAMQNLIGEAEDVADQQGEDLNADWTSFGPTNVTLHQIDALTRFEDGWSALEAASSLDAESLAALSRERRARHLITEARANVLTRRPDAAVQAVVTANALAPEEVQGRPSTVSLVKDLLGASPAPGRELRNLAQRCGLRA
ncbi:helix-turn-helix domain-containing protein [Streptomyces sp. JJ66]|uniref:helix-turn-helix domain-containing protein n=1 Tax=Streptomyces sp. JJ66 TaxID=2803843 RepID=UPI00214C8C88|nr:helix-turn-helix transcriptional regulator [Streptomyces sp. JJ66]